MKQNATVVQIHDFRDFLPAFCGKAENKGMKACATKSVQLVQHIDGTGIEHLIPVRIGTKNRENITFFISERICSFTVMALIPAQSQAVFHCHQCMPPINNDGKRNRFWHLPKLGGEKLREAIRDSMSDSAAVRLL